MAQQRLTRIPTPAWLLMGPCIFEIDCIVIREVQYQLEVNRLKGNFGRVWPMWAGHPRVGNGAMHKVQYQLEVNRQFCVGAPGLVIGPYIVEIDRIVIREVQYQLEVNRCRNEKVIVKGNFGWVWRLVMGPCIAEIDRIVMHKFQYQFEVNRYRNEEIIVKGNLGWVWSMWAGCPMGIDCIVIRQFQDSSAYSVGGDGGQDGQTDRRTAEITQYPHAFKKAWG
ncbi:hypothetical protein DPMN_008644 [Dreissena polymorpha]|uniref:Uncharacterized protein n=1 Tax=Dreissena polymorpha TaxID=45954 RepID=A0A9D4MVN0_DREPO|nr:hypothetical protein DPMN_008644 [Dreissena polymorpha]